MLVGNQQHGEIVGSQPLESSSNHHKIQCKLLPRMLSVQDDVFHATGVRSESLDLLTLKI